MKTFETFGVIGLVVSVCVLCLCTGQVVFLQVPFHLTVGWVRFLSRVARDTQIDFQAWSIVLACLAALSIGVHSFACWLAGGNRWRLRWSLVLLAGFVLLAGAGVAMVGMTHQSIWLATSPERLIDPARGAVYHTISTNNLKQVALSVHGHQDVHNQLPAGVTYDEQGGLLHGWPVAVLPFLEQDALFKKIDLKAPWDDVRHDQAFSEPVPQFLHPMMDLAKDERGRIHLHYAGNVHLLGSNRAWHTKAITDGMSHTILMGEIAKETRPWGYPLHARDPGLGLNASKVGFGTVDRSGVVQFGMGDGSVRGISGTVSPSVLRALSTPNGGEKIDERELD